MNWRSLAALFGMAARRMAGGRLLESEMKADPLEQFQLWFENAKAQSGEPNPNAVCLCTLSAEGWPEGRMVLLKGQSGKGFDFYTNYESDKAKALDAHPKAELVLHWDRLGRQLRIQGSVARLGRAESEAYFATRLRGSQLGAWASDQSRPAESRHAMDLRLAEFEKKFQGQPVPCPPHWGGYRLTPRRYEFWQADPIRFHDRFQYINEGGSWLLKRLYP